MNKKSRQLFDLLMRRAPQSDGIAIADLRQDASANRLLPALADLHEQGHVVVRRGRVFFTPNGSADRRRVRGTVKRYTISALADDGGAVKYRILMFEHANERTGQWIGDFETRAEAEAEMQRRQAADNRRRVVKLVVMSQPPDGGHSHSENASTMTEARLIASGLRQQGHRDVQIIPVPLPVTPGEAH